MRIAHCRLHIRGVEGAEQLCRIHPRRQFVGAGEVNVVHHAVGRMSCHEGREGGVGLQVVEVVERAVAIRKLVFEMIAHLTVEFAEEGFDVACAQAVAPRLGVVVGKLVRAVVGE